KPVNPSSMISGTDPLLIEGKVAKTTWCSGRSSRPWSASEEWPQSKGLSARSACTILSGNPTGLCTLQLQSLASRAEPSRTARCGHREPRSRQRETGLAQSEKRKLSCPQSVGLPPQVGAPGGRPLPSHSTRRELLQSSATGLATGGRGCS